MSCLRSQSHLLAAAVMLAIACAMPACQNVPSHRKIMRYHRHQELVAAQELADLRSLYEEGEITEATYLARSRLVVENAPEKAMDALYRDYLLSTRTAFDPATRR